MATTSSPLPSPTALNSRDSDPKQGRPARPTASFLIASIVLAMFGSACLARYERGIYDRKVIRLKLMKLSVVDDWLISWSIWGKTLLLLVPVIAVASTLLWRGWRKTGLAVFLGGTAAIWTFFVVDIRLQDVTGAHISDYIFEVTRPDHWEFAGDASQIVSTAVWHGAAGLGASLGFLALGTLLFGLAARRLRFFRSPTVAWIGCVALAVALFGIVPARHYGTNALALERLYTALPNGELLFTPESVPLGAGTAFRVNCDNRFTASLRPLWEAAKAPVPNEPSPKFVNADPPDVVVFILESFRSDAVRPAYMPRLDAWSQTGLRLEQHFACANRSDLGGFAILYGRSPVVYDVTVSSGIKPGLVEGFRDNGYETHLLASTKFTWKGMTAFLGPAAFDHVTLYDEDPDWVERDRASIAKVQEAIRDGGTAESTGPATNPATTSIVPAEVGRAPGRKPRFVVCWLMSTHFGYTYPPEYAKWPTAMAADATIRTRLSREDLTNRYRNACAFMDDLLGDFVSGVDPKRTVVLVTGDHGESFGEDGTITHASRLSEAQTRVPVLLVGGGVPARRVESITSHVDLLPTLLHAAGGMPVRFARAPGVDLLDPAGIRPEDEHAMVVQKYWESWEILLRRPGRNLMLNMRRPDSVVRLIGFARQDGMVDSRLTRPPTEAKQWSELIDRTVARQGAKGNSVATTQAVIPGH